MLHPLGGRTRRGHEDNKQTYGGLHQGQHAASIQQCFNVEIEDPRQHSDMESTFSEPVAQSLSVTLVRVFQINRQDREVPGRTGHCDLRSGSELEQ
jgi:hypothetical protein